MQVEKQVEKVGGPEMYVCNATKVDRFKRNAVSPTHGIVFQIATVR